jgi:serine/threonine protein phosphatase 1
MNNKIIAFGDIHGNYHAAETAVKLAEKLKVKAVFLGDYVDRGPSGIKTLQTLIKAKKNNSDWIFLMGNHEQMLMDLINEKNKPEDIGTLMDGSQFDYAQSEHSYNEWIGSKDDDQCAVVEFIESTKLFYETPHLIFTHAVLRDTGSRLQEKSKEELLFNYDDEPKWQGKKFIHGHKNIQKVCFSGNSININTFCGYGGHLTGLLINLETTKPIKLFSISEAGELLNEENIQTENTN